MEKKTAIIIALWLIASLPFLVTLFLPTPIIFEIQIEPDIKETTITTGSSLYERNAIGTLLIVPVIMAIFSPPLIGYLIINRKAKKHSNKAFWIIATFYLVISVFLYIAFYNQCSLILQATNP